LDLRDSLKKEFGILWVWLIKIKNKPPSLQGLIKTLRTFSEVVLGLPRASNKNLNSETLQDFVGGVDDRRSG
jgi:hypothetical protein